MATRSSFIYINAESVFDQSRLLSALGRLGLALENPTNRKILMLSWDGEQVAVGRSEFADRIQRGADTSFQLWFAKNDSLYVRVKVNRAARVIELGMEGTSEQERMALKAVLEEYFDALADEGVAMGFIFDPVGVTEDYDWDRFFSMEETLSPAVLPVGLPDLLVIARSLLSRISGFSVHPYGDGNLQLIQLSDMRKSEA